MTLFLVTLVHVLTVLTVINVKMINDHVNQTPVGTMVVYLSSYIKNKSLGTHMYFIGTCNETSKTTFKCLCNEGWIGDHCETMINYCENVICLNNGVCRPSFMNYTCECLDESYSGRHCENVATSRVILKTVTKSLGYIAMIVLGVVVGFFVIMDVLKYGFGIDPVKEEREKIRRAKAIERMKKRRRVLVQKFTYVNEPSTEGKSANIRE